MGDSTGNKTLQQLQKRENEEYTRCDILFHATTLCFEKVSIPFILNHIDCFVSETRGNESVAILALNMYSVCGNDDEVWDKVGQAVGNLQSLERLSISNHRFDDYNYDDGDDDDDDDDDPCLGEIGSHLEPYAAEGRGRAR
jgi:hypothetical protein